MHPWPPRRRALAALSSFAVLGPLASMGTGAQDPSQGEPDAPPADPDAPQLVTLPLSDVSIELQFDAAIAPALRAHVAQAVQRAAAAVRGYLGRFPIAEFELQVEGVAGRGVRGGTTFGEPAPWIRIRLGRDTTMADFDDDWVLVHEMIHLAVPRVPRHQRWLHEGIATYVEAVARARIGWVEPAEVWREWMRGMPQGLPQAGDAGLDHTPTWGRTYWGGALFCLLADVQLLQRSDGRQGLQQALQGLLAVGGDYRQTWDASRILGAADAAVGSAVLEELYEAHRATVVHTDLPALWHALGVTSSGLDDSAPLAPCRRAILSPRE